MPTPTEHKTVQARILAYAQEIGWKFVSRGRSEGRRERHPDGVPKDYSLFFHTFLHKPMTAKTRFLEKEITA